MARRTYSVISLFLQAKFRRRFAVQSISLSVCIRWGFRSLLREGGKFLEEMGRRNVKYKENVVSTVQKRLNWSSRRLERWVECDIQIDGRAHWCHLSNTVERFCAAAMSKSVTRSDDAASSQITLGFLVTDYDSVICVIWLCFLMSRVREIWSYFAIHTRKYKHWLAYYYVSISIKQ